MPRIVDIELPGTDLIDEVYAELTMKAEGDNNSCFGYFPSLINADGIVTDLPSSRLLASTLPNLEVKGLLLYFNFIRRSLVRQNGDSPFHLDTDADTALTGDIHTLQNRLVWRLLINLSAQHSRRLSYLDEDPMHCRYKYRGVIFTVPTTQ